MGAERLVELGHVVDVVAEDPLNDRASRVDLRRVPFRVTEYLPEHWQGPGVEAALDDPEG